MLRLDEISRNISSIIFANNYQTSIRDNKYVFFPILNIDSLRFFWINDSEFNIQFIVDFSNQLYYICDTDKILTIGERIPDFEHQQIIKYYNYSKSNQQEAIINIGKIIKSISENEILSNI